jgi:hypothetical protein
MGPPLKEKAPTESIQTALATPRYIQMRFPYSRGEGKKVNGAPLTALSALFATGLRGR